eukprot:1878387-Rhodomonas_salina.3
MKPGEQGIDAVRDRELGDEEAVGEGLLLRELRVSVLHHMLCYLAVQIQQHSLVRPSLNPLLQLLQRLNHSPQAIYIAHRRAADCCLRHSPLRRAKFDDFHRANAPVASQHVQQIAAVHRLPVHTDHLITNADLQHKDSNHETIQKRADWVKASRKRRNSQQPGSGSRVRGRKYLPGQPGWSSRNDSVDHIGCIAPLVMFCCSQMHPQSACQYKAGLEHMHMEFQRPVAFGRRSHWKSFRQAGLSPSQSRHSLPDATSPDQRSPAKSSPSPENCAQAKSSHNSTLTCASARRS